MVSRVRIPPPPPMQFKQFNLGDKQHKAWAGHLNRAVVSATFEAIIDTTGGELDREFSEEIGLNLLKID